MVNSGMNCVGTYAFLVILAFGSPLIGQDFTEAEAEFNAKFRNLIRYESASSQPGFEDTTEFNKQLEEAGKKADEFLESMMGDSDKTGSLVFSVFEKTQSPGGKCNLINFAGLHGLGKNLFLPVMHDIINDSYPPIAHDRSLIASAATYIGRKGGNEDIKSLLLLAKYSSTYGVQQIAKGAIREIQKREGVSVKEDKGLPLWVLIIGGVVLLAIVVAVVRRK